MLCFSAVPFNRQLTLQQKEKLPYLSESNSRCPSKRKSTPTPQNKIKIKMPPEVSQSLITLCILSISLHALHKMQTVRASKSLQLGSSPSGGDRLFSASLCVIEESTPNKMLHGTIST